MQESALFLFLAGLNRKIVQMFSKLTQVVSAVYDLREAEVSAAAFCFLFAVEFLFGGFRFFKIQYYAVDAISQAGRRRAVVENVPQVRLTAAAHDFDAMHSEAIVRSLGNGFLADRLKETRPSASALVFSVAFEKGIAANGAVECTDLF